VSTPVSDRTVTLRRTFDARRERVFRAWTEPDAIADWFGTRGTEVVSAAVDLRVGGDYKLVVRGGGQTGELYGTYREAEPPGRLVYTWQWHWPDRRTRESLVTVEFHDLGDATEMVLTHEGLRSDNSVQFHTTGWNESLERFGELLG